MDAARDDVAVKVLEIIGRYARVDRAPQLEDRLEDLKIDSLGLMELVFDLEEAFDIEIDINANRAEEVRESWRDVSRAIDTVARLVQVRATS